MGRRKRGGKWLAVELLESRLLLAGDPLANWHFDSAAGTTVVDSQAGHNGALTGAPTWMPTAGTALGALRLYSDADGATVTAADAPLVQSVSLWFKADTTRPVAQGSNTATKMVLFEAGDSTHGASIYIYNNLLYVGAWNNGVANWASGTFVSTSLIRAGRWHHVVLTLNPGATLVAGALTAYLDGAPFGSADGAQIRAAAPIGFGNVDGTTRFHDGVSAAGNNRGFAGFLDEARVYGETLSAADVVTIRDETKPTAPEEEYMVRESGRVADLAVFRFPNVMTSEHFAMKWGNNNTSGLAVNPTMIQQNLNRLEQAWHIIVDQAGMEGPKARNQGTAAPVKYKVNFYVLETGLWVSTGGGAFSGPDAENFGAMYVSPWAMGGGTSVIPNWNGPGTLTVTNTTTTPHEFTHVLQYESGGFRNSDFASPFWETHANFGASLVDKVIAENSINGRFGQRRHRYYNATDFRYESHLFLNYLAQLPQYGPQFVTHMLWEDPSAIVNNADPYQVLIGNFGFADPKNQFADLYVDFVARTVTYKTLFGGALTGIPAHNTTARKYRTYLEADAVNPGWYRVPESDTLEQYGANIAPLSLVGRVAGAEHTVTVNLDGYDLPGQSGTHRATLVAVGVDGHERYSSSWSSGETSFTLEPNEQYLYLTVTAIPVEKNYIWSNPFFTIGGQHGIERFPYRVSMTGAVPMRSEAEGPRTPPPGVAGHFHPNGGGFVANTATVASTAYVGPSAQVLNSAQVLGNARIEDYATISNTAVVSGSAIVRGHAKVENNATVSGSAIVGDFADVQRGAVSEFARVEGNALVNTNGGQVRGNALVKDYGEVIENGTLVTGDTVVKGYGFAAGGAQLTGNSLIAESGAAIGTSLVTTMGVNYNAEPAASEVPLMTTQYNNLFARYDFAAADPQIVWDSFNTTYGYESATPPTWQANTGDVVTGVLQFQNDNQSVELSSELAELRDYTIATWVKWDGTGDANQRIFEFARDSSNYIYLQPTSSSGGVKFVIAVNGVEKTLEGAAPLTANQWKHVAVTFSANTVTLYVNASAKAIRTDVNFDPQDIRAAYGLLGRGLNSPGFRGMVDSLRVYSKALAANDVLALVQLVLPGYVPDPGVNPPGSDAIAILQFAVHDNTGQLVANRESVANGDLRNSSFYAPAESASPGGMTSAGATYVTYSVASEGLTGRPGADGYAMNTVTGYVSFADAGSPLEQALATSDTFAVMARVKRLTDSGQFEFVLGRSVPSVTTGMWSLAVDSNDHIVASMGGVSYDTGVIWLAGAWHEVGLTYDGSGAGDGTVLVYVDGRRMGAFQPGAIGTGQAFALGAGLAGASLFRGWFDHVEFWDYTADDATMASYSNLPATTLPGDYDGDADVDGADFLLWQRGLGSAASPAGSVADGNRNGLVDSYDMGVWRANFDRPLASAVAASVFGEAVAAAIQRPDGVDESRVPSLVAAASPAAGSQTEVALLDHVMGLSNQIENPMPHTRRFTGLVPATANSTHLSRVWQTRDEGFAAFADEHACRHGPLTRPAQARADFESIGRLLQLDIDSDPGNIG